MRKQRIPGSRTAIFRTAQVTVKKTLGASDETATSTNMVRLRGRCPRGERLVGFAPHGIWKTITLVAGVRNNGFVAPLLIDGSMNGTTFLAYLDNSGADA
ncbi:MAG: hypothetical protein ACXWKG_20310 [Limisphaerales bacterium]